MTTLETLERLLTVIELQAEIIRKQAEALEQADISAAVMTELRQIRERTEKELSPVKSL